MTDIGGTSMPDDEDFDFGGEYEAPLGVVPVPAEKALDYPDTEDQDTLGGTSGKLFGFVGGGGRTPAQAIATAKNWHLRGLYFGVGQCLATIRKCYNVGPKYGTAALSWEHAKHKNQDKDGRDAPRGAPVWWTGGSKGAGHVAISVGGGLCLSTDWARPGKIDYARINEITSRWNLNYRGWTREINDVLVWEPAPPKATVHLNELKPGKRGPSVVKVKKALRKKGYRGFVVRSNKFGGGTRRAYKKYQERLGYHGADADGIPGKNSLQKLGFKVLP